MLSTECHSGLTCEIAQQSLDLLGGAGIHDPQRMNPTDFGVPLNFCLLSP